MERAQLQANNHKMGRRCGLRGINRQIERIDCRGGVRKRSRSVKRLLQLVKNMTEVPLLPIRERIKDLNTKAYYLLVALSFVYRYSQGVIPVKLAISLTILSAILPVQDYVTSARTLEWMRSMKVIFLAAALICTLIWIWAY